MSELEPLDPEIQSLVREEGAHIGAPDIAKAKARARLELSISTMGIAFGAISDASGTSPREHATPASTGAGLGSRLKTLLTRPLSIGISAFALGGAVGAMTHATLAPQKPAKIVRVDRPTVI